LHYTEYLLSDIAILLKGCIAKRPRGPFERNTKSIMQTARPGCWNSALPSGFHFHLPRALACGNTLRGDDGVGPFSRRVGRTAIRFRFQHPRHLPPAKDSRLAEDIAHAESVLFIDCSVESAPGSINLRPVINPPRSKASPPITRAQRNFSPSLANSTIPCPRTRSSSPSAPAPWP